METMSDVLRLGLDIGSTTVKLAVLDSGGRLVHSCYERHHSDVRSAAARIMREFLASPAAASAREFRPAVSGSGGMALAGELGVPFIQEVVAASESVGRLVPGADVVIELGGEDAKLTFLTGGREQRMNETCAGGTGAFIDRMAAFLGTDAAGLDGLALKGSVIHPIASRCGVFAKADVLPLLNEGCPKEDVALSIFQAVVNQTVGGLACGRRIRGRVVFLGGPLTFLKGLRNRFAETLRLAEDNAVFPDHGEFFVAMGAAFLAGDRGIGRGAADALVERLSLPSPDPGASSLAPLFRSEEEYREFRARHGALKVPRCGMDDCRGPVWLGIDAGSTTVKTVLMDDAGRVLHETYAPNRGGSLEIAAAMLKEVLALLPPGVEVGGACSTGYGADLMRAGLKLDCSEVETVAHARAAVELDPKVSFVLDIGGQDIKCLSLAGGIITDVRLNEACSSGCGSFIETFAESLGVGLDRFVAMALQAGNPVDLGTRCTVFMNSRVKQAQKEGRSLGDIAAGLSYSVIRNALYKVIKIRDIRELGGCIMAQGGAFRSDALLRALEILAGPVLRCDLSGCMGAYGAALLARDRADGRRKSSMLSADELASFSFERTSSRCGGCGNNCMLSICRFSDGRRHVSGNRCDRGAGGGEGGPSAPDLAAEKNSMLFDGRTPLPLEKAPRGVVGIPRALNMYDSYPFWFALFTRLGFRVLLSPESDGALCRSGMETVPSQSVCHPAKLCHGHIVALAGAGVRRIFYPCVFKERKEFPGQTNRFNCPVVSGYPELIRNNVDLLRETGTALYAPFIDMDSGSGIVRELGKLELFNGVSESELEEAVACGRRAQDDFRSRMRRRGEEVLCGLARTGRPGIILAGHPYHVDPEVGHGIGRMIARSGIAVLTEDSVAHLAEPERGVHAVDQWTYHARLYRAAALAAASGRPVPAESPLHGRIVQWPSLALVHLVSFGCGLDAITGDQVREILMASGGAHAQIKLDEGSGAGAVRIRIRSLTASMEMKAAKKRTVRTRPASVLKAMADVEAFERWSPPPFTEEMKAERTILIPQMSPPHFRFLPDMLRGCGYKAELLESVGREDFEEGLRHVNNDLCYPAITVVGQLVNAVKSGRFARKDVALILSQTGGSCRATNYLSLLKRALYEAGLRDVPVLSFNYAGMSANPGFKVDAGMTLRGLMSVVCGDLVSRLVLRVSPYAVDRDAVRSLADRWSGVLAGDIRSGSPLAMLAHCRGAVRAFDSLPLATEKRRPRVGLVGEILLKYHPDANNHAVATIEEEGGEAVLPDMLDFFLYNAHGEILAWKRGGGGFRRGVSSWLLMKFAELLRAPVAAALKSSTRFDPPRRFRELLGLIDGLVSEEQQAGEGWLLTAEMAELLEGGVGSVLCLQPFGCLPNHVTGKGVMKELRRRHPGANIAAVDYDAGASEVNQVNRIKLLMALAREQSEPSAC